ncbi:uncharacterized protein A4U43_C09F7620 [Asparagus officinalis]|uniref:Reverse transcriptase domain-containing protein n=1 Tax=Asparagus officinalis TaxID=4686 RepID=A0A5P1E7Q7_ASPOF|nr:uncharacterized protein A4U43_C09F7620 [Asparagus officinalis]
MKFVLLFIRSYEEQLSRICLSTLSKLQEGDLDSLKAKYSDLFSKITGLPPRQGVEHEIMLTGESSLPNIGIYRTSIQESEEIKKQVQELLETGVVIPSCSPYRLPVLLMPKKDGGWRILVGGVEVLHEVGSEVWLSSGKDSGGRHLEDGDQGQTGHVRVVEDFVIVYLDGILVYSRTWEEHLIHVEKVFRVLQDGQLKLSGKKCEFGKDELVYLGFIVGKRQMRIDPGKVAVITKWPAPKTVTEVRSFMGAC